MLPCCGLANHIVLNEVAEPLTRPMTCLTKFYTSTVPTEQAVHIQTRTWSERGTQPSYMLPWLQQPCM